MRIYMVLLEENFYTCGINLSDRQNDFLPLIYWTLMSTQISSYKESHFNYYDDNQIHVYIYIYIWVFILYTAGICCL